MLKCLIQCCLNTGTEYRKNQKILAVQGISEKLLSVSLALVLLVCRTHALICF